MGGISSSEDVRGANLAGSTPPFLGRERAAVGFLLNKPLSLSLSLSLSSPPSHHCFAQFRDIGGREEGERGVGVLPASVPGAISFTHTEDGHCAAVSEGNLRLVFQTAAVDRQGPKKPHV